MPGRLRCVMEPDDIHTISPSDHVEVLLDREHAWTLRDIHDFSHIEQEIRRIGEHARRQAEEAAKQAALRRERHADLLLLKPQILRWLRGQCPKHYERRIETILGNDSFIDSLYVTIAVPPSTIVAETLSTAKERLHTAEAALSQATTGIAAYLTASNTWRAEHYYYNNLANIIASMHEGTWSISEVQEWPSMRLEIQSFLTRVSASASASGVK